MRELPIAEKTRQSGCHYDRIYVSYSFLIDFLKVIAIQKLMGFLTKPNTEVVDGCCLRATVLTRAAITLVSCSGTQSSFTLSPCTCASYTRNLVRQYDNSQLNGVSDQEKWTIALWYYLFIYIWWLPSMHTTWTGDKRDQEWTQDFKGGGVGEGYHGSVRISASTLYLQNSKIKTNWRWKWTFTCIYLL